MSYSESARRAAGAWLAVASLLLVVTLAFHGPIAVDLADQMARIAAAQARWATVHWIAAVSLSAFAGSALLMLVSGSRLVGGPWMISAWAVVAVGALWTLTTAVAEVTVVADLATSGDLARFEAWWSFAEGNAHGFSFLALAVAAIAAREATWPDPVTPPWAARLGAAAGVASFAGWALGMWFDIGPANLLWVAASIVMCLWTGWFGAGLARGRADGEV